MSNGKIQMDRIEVLYKALTDAEFLHSMALDRYDYDTANFIADTIDNLDMLLAEAIISKVQYTAADDIRYFEINP